MEMHHSNIYKKDLVKKMINAGADYHQYENNYLVQNILESIEQNK